MTYELYRYVFIGGLIGCGIFFTLGVVFFFTMKIPKVISDLSGRTARKAIEHIRLQNEQSGDKTYKSSAVNMERGKITDKISRSGRLIPREETPFGTGPSTEKISTQELPNAGETEVLTAGETEVLTAYAGETEVLVAPAGETELLSAPAGETEVLSAPVGMGQTAELAPAMPVAFTVEYEITFIHTQETIPQEV